MRPVPGFPGAGFNFFERGVAALYVRAVFRAGHMGTGKSYEMVRYLKVNDMAEVLTVARKMPRVKKSGAALVKCERISKKQYIEGKREEKRDPYLNNTG